MTALFALFFVIGTALAKAAHHDSIVGTWRLVAYEDRPVQGGTSRFPYGEKPQGLLIYDSTGHMSLQIMKTPHPRVAEKADLFDAYTAYFGKYHVDEDRGVVVHHVQADMAGVYIDQDEERPYVIHDDRLMLKPKWFMDGKPWEGTRVFVKVSDQTRFRY
jgi:hypothetical protein